MSKLKSRTVRQAEIGERLRELRGIRPRTKVAEQMGISYSALCKYEYGEKRPGDETKRKIARYYGKTVQEIFFDSEYDVTT